MNAINKKQDRAGEGFGLLWVKRLSVLLVMAALAGCNSGGGSSGSAGGTNTGNGTGSSGGTGSGGTTGGGNTGSGNTGGGSSGGGNTGGGNTGGGNTGGGNTGGGSTGAGQTGMRISRILYDFDNNGTFEGERRITYQSDGRIASETYVYTPDGTPDANLGSFTLSGPKDNQNQTVNYSYDANGLLSTVVSDSGVDRNTDTYSYAANGMLTRMDSLSVNGVGAVTGDVSWTHTLTGARLDEYKLFVAGNGSPLLQYTLSYNSAGQLDTDLQTVLVTGQQSMYTYTWRNDGQISVIDEIDPAPGATYQASTKFSYDASGHLVSRLYTTTFKNETYRWDFILNGSGLPTEMRVDLGANGSVEAVVRYEWEQATCQKVYMWQPRAEPNFVMNANVPYKPGTGYVVIPVCGG